MFIKSLRLAVLVSLLSVSRTLAVIGRGWRFQSIYSKIWDWSWKYWPRYRDDGSWLKSTPRSASQHWQHLLPSGLTSCPHPRRPTRNWTSGHSGITQYSPCDETFLFVFPITCGSVGIGVSCSMNDLAIEDCFRCLLVSLWRVMFVHPLFGPSISKTHFNEVHYWLYHCSVHHTVISFNHLFVH